MASLDALRENRDLFFQEVPQLPQGRYVHFVLVRETESFSLFHTDGTLNVIRVAAGIEDRKPVARLVIFKRKQSTPERLTGRELLRFYSLISDDGDRKCEYNSADFCKRCPDCILYGYAIGDQGAEKSKVQVDSAFSVTPYEESHKAFSFNALYEHGTMTRGADTRASFGEQDHVVPQVFFPAIVTLRDPTYEAFLYVLGNLLRTSRYGAQDSRTGSVRNHLVACLFSNGEIFSNLHFTRAIHDQLRRSGTYQSPLVTQEVLEAARETYGALMLDEPVARVMEIQGPAIDQLVAETAALYQDSQRSRALLERLYDASEGYSQRTNPRRK
jgi:CRISPR-associated protein Csc2